RQIESLWFERLLRFRAREYLDQLGVEPVDDLGRSSGWRDIAAPRVDLITLDALFIERGHARQEGRALEARHPERPEPAIPDLTDHQRDIEKTHRHLIRYDRKHGLRRAPEGNVHEISTGGATKQHTRQVVAGTAAARCERQRSRLRLRDRNDVRHR